MLKRLRIELRALATESEKENSARYFKAGRGEYGEGDLFLGVNVPDTRAAAKKYRDLDQQSLGSLATKLSEETLTEFLLKYKNKLRRTILPYAIEKYPEMQSKAFLVRG